MAPLERTFIRMMTRIIRIGLANGLPTNQENQKVKIILLKQEIR
jgi:hypothetical protein